MAGDTVKLEDLDPEFKRDKTSGAETKQRSALEDLDPVFTIKPDSVKLPNEPFKRQTVMSEPIPREISTPGGALLGAAASKWLPIQSADLGSSGDISKLQYRANVANEMARRAEQTAAAARATPPVGVDTLTTQLDQARANRDALSKAYQDALENARKLNAIPEPAATSVVSTGPEPTAPKLSAGAERHAGKMSEIRQANLVQRGLEGAKGFEGMGRIPGYERVSRLIVPSELAGASVYNPDQLAAQQRLAQAKAEFDAAQREMAKLQGNLDKLTSPTRTKPLDTAAQRAQIQAQKASIALEEAEKMRVKPGPLTRVASSRLLPILSGAGAGLDLANAMKLWQEGKYGESIPSFIGAGGGVLSMIPTVPTRALGTALSMAPLAYEALKPSQ